jgi:thiol:disulfide interchange protein DsbD
VASGLSLLPVIALALAGGLILNLMPCVLPVLSVKALAMLRHAGPDRATLARHGAAYTAGVLASFAVVAGALIALRAAGAEIGWGFQLQSPVFVALLSYVFFALALSLSGVIVIGSRIAGAGHGLASRPSYAGSFFTGALATVAATPCTAPFMGVAVGFALSAPPATALVVFEALGLGLALPYLLLTLVPAWSRLLPRPGAWMIRLEQLLAFPLYATVAWLVWVVSRQSGPEGVAAVLAGLVLIAFAAWVVQATRTAGGRWRRAATGGAGLAVLIAIALGPLVATGPAAPDARSAASGAIAWEPFSARRVTELRAQGQPVFVNFTAAWCVTCLVNERVALGSSAVAEAFRKKGVAYLKADWTNRDPEIAQVLGSFGRSGVPLYVVYPPARPGRPDGGQPSILPQILSEGTIIDAIEKL